MPIEPARIFPFGNSMDGSSPKFASGWFAIGDQVLDSGSYISPVFVQFAVSGVPLYSPPRIQTFPLGKTLDAKYKRSMLIGANADHAPFA